MKTDMPLRSTIKKKGETEEHDEKKIWKNSFGASALY